VKPSVISAEALFEEHRPILHWEWIAGHAHPERRLDEAAVRNAQSATDLVGYRDYIHPYRVQIDGWREVEYLCQRARAPLSRPAPDLIGPRISSIVPPAPTVMTGADAQPPPE